jgi:hypothetical protein
MDETDRPEVFRGPSVEAVPIFVRYCVNFFTAVALQLQLQHIHQLVSMQPVGGVHLGVQWLLHFLASETLLQSTKTH